MITHFYAFRIISITYFASIGKWKYEKSQDHDDYGLVVSEKANKYGISYNLPYIIDPNEETLTLQYDVRFQKGINCAGAYLKFILPKVL
jgi:calnexin